MMYMHGCGVAEDGTKAAKCFWCTEGGGRNSAPTASFNYYG